MVESSSQKGKEEDKKVTVDDFEFYKQVGEGSYGQVYLALQKDKNKFVAIKQLFKGDLIRMEKTEAVMREKDLLKLLTKRPFIINLQQTFMDRDNLYFVFDHCKYGTLSNLITQSGKLSPKVANFYAACIVQALQQCLDFQIMHRDLKPENLLINENKQIRLVSKANQTPSNL